MKNPFEDAEKPEIEIRVNRGGVLLIGLIATAWYSRKWIKAELKK